MKKFLYIVTLTIALNVYGLANAAEPSGQETAVISEAPTLSVGRNSLTVKGGEDCNMLFEVYSITGQLIKRFKLDDGSYTLELPRGCYIVKCSRWSKKAIIKG